MMSYVTGTINNKKNRASDQTYIFIILCAIGGDMFSAYLFLSVVADKDTILTILL